jgi:transcriptional regulator with XRE-family HTH domain
MSRTLHTKEYKAFLERLCQARKEKGLTQVEVANHLGRHQSYVAKCENGERRVDVIELAELADLYEKPLEYFLGR